MARYRLLAGFAVLVGFALVAGILYLSIAWGFHAGAASEANSKHVDTFIQASIGVLTALILMLTLHLTLRINRIMKLVDVTKDCMDQYHRLHDRKLSREMFLNKLWHLHYLQYRYYRLGFLESDLYKLWLQNRHKEYFGHGTDLEQKCWHDA